MLRRAFRYDWRLWTIPELAEMLEEAGFDGMRAWLRPMKVQALTAPDLPFFTFSVNIAS